MKLYGKDPPSHISGLLHIPLSYRRTMAEINDTVCNPSVVVRNNWSNYTRRSIKNTNVISDTLLTETTSESGDLDKVFH